LSSESCICFEFRIWYLEFVWDLEFEILNFR